MLRRWALEELLRKQRKGRAGPQSAPTAQGSIASFEAHDTWEDPDVAYGEGDLL